MNTDIINSGIAQFGAFGIMIIGLVWLTKFLIVYNFNQLKAKDTENRQLEKEFREHLIENEKNLLAIVDKNTDAYEKLSIAFENNSRSIDSLAETINRKFDDKVKK